MTIWRGREEPDFLWLGGDYDGVLYRARVQDCELRVRGDVVRLGTLDEIERVIDLLRTAAVEMRDQRRQDEEEWDK